MTKMIPLILAAAILQQLPPNQAAAPPSTTYRPGQDVTSPVLLHETKPNYTAEAMRARIQGIVTLECVVMPDGSVGEVRVTRSLDTQFGLDQQAVNTLEQWRFRPGMKDGTAVPVLVMVEISYSLGRTDDVPPPSATPVAGGVSSGDATAPLAWPDAFGEANAAGSSIAFVDATVFFRVFPWSV